MVAGAFPIAKLAYLALRQISKPIANQIKNGAKSSEKFRRYVCLPPAQFYHFVETRFKMYLLGFGRAPSRSQITPLNEQMAVELGAELLGEGAVFLMAASSIYLEYNRQSKNTKLKEEQLEKRLEMMEDRLNRLQEIYDRQNELLNDIRQESTSILTKLKQKLIKSQQTISAVDIKSIDLESKIDSNNYKDHRIKNSAIEKSFFDGAVIYACDIILESVTSGIFNLENGSVSNSLFCVDRCFEMFAF
uniref:OPA3-like protein n=1 Tax=Romanomermis culicivorax TaxID=13658 RepID=A0A915KHX4_ROMCU